MGFRESAKNRVAFFGIAPPFGILLLAFLAMLANVAWGICSVEFCFGMMFVAVAWFCAGVGVLAAMEFWPESK